MTITSEERNDLREMIPKYQAYRDSNGVIPVFSIAGAGERLLNVLPALLDALDEQDKTIAYMTERHHNIIIELTEIQEEVARLKAALEREQSIRCKDCPAAQELRDDNARLRLTVEAYAVSARSVAVNLNEYCEKSLPFPKMVEEATLGLRDEHDRLQPPDVSLEARSPCVLDVPGRVIITPDRKPRKSSGGDQKC